MGQQHCQSTTSGNWTSSFSCSGSGPFTTYSINSGDTIYVTSNITGIDTLSVEGVLTFNSGKKLTLDSSGFIVVYPGGEINGGNTGTKFIFSGTGNTISGPFSISGPAHADDSSGTSFEMGTLPVTWSGFWLHITSDETLEYAWSTACELNNMGFDVLFKKFNGTWETIGMVETSNPGGNALMTTHYRFEIPISHVPEDLQSAYCLRLLQRDFSGETSLSPIQCVTTEVKSFGIRVFPSPCDDNFTITWPTTYDDLHPKVKVSDLAGRSVDFEMETFSLYGYRINTNHWAPGAYLVSLYSAESGLFSSRLIKIR